MKNLIVVIFSILLLNSCNKSRRSRDLVINTTAEHLSFDIEETANTNDITFENNLKTSKAVVVLNGIEVEVPYIIVDMPNESGKLEKTIMVESEFAGVEHDFEIKEMFLSRTSFMISQY